MEVHLPTLWSYRGCIYHWYFVTSCKSEYISSQIRCSPNALVDISFECLTGLRSLSLQHIHVTLTPNSFDRCRMLRVIRLVDTGLLLHHLPKICLHPYLVSLYLIDNELNSLPVINCNPYGNDSHHIFTLDKLALENANISKLPPGPPQLQFSNHLSFLSLSHNFISSLDKYALFGLSSTEYLDLSYNKLSYLPHMLFEYTPRVTFCS